MELNIKGKIYRKVKEQYSELEECIQIFEPIKNLKSGNLDMEINEEKNKTFFYK